MWRGAGRTGRDGDFRDRSLHLFFNYRSNHNECWAEPEKQKDRKYEALYPLGLALDLE